MKKIKYSIFICLCFAFTAQAQDSDETESVSQRSSYTNRHGIYLLPEYQDFAIGIDATPILNFLDNFISKDRIDPGKHEDVTFSGVNSTIYGKYFLNDNRAIRAKLKMDIRNYTYKGVVRDDEEFSNNPLNALATVVDVKQSNSTNLDLRVGYEFRRGAGRLQGFYGGEVGIEYSFHKERYKYANPITEANQTPSTWDFGGNMPMPRTLKLKQGRVISPIVAGFVGVEYFFAPKISIGGELNLTFVYRPEMQTELTTEEWNIGAGKVTEQTTRYDSWPNSNLATGIDLSTKTAALFFLMFHF